MAMGCDRGVGARAGRQAARKGRELAGTGSVWGRLGLKGCSRLSTCQQAMRILRALHIGTVKMKLKTGCPDD
jgi:hypothetical protein